MSFRILLVDHEVELLDIYCFYLEQQPGIICETALDGDEALQKTLENSYSLIVMDYFMPKMLGNVLIDYIRAPGNPNCEVPIIVASGVSNLDTKGLKKVYLLEKPFDIGSFCNLVREFMDNMGYYTSKPDVQ